MELKEAYKMVYNDLITNRGNMLRGIYDAKNGDKDFMYGIAHVLDIVAFIAGDDELVGDFNSMFYGNMVKSRGDKK